MCKNRSQKVSYGKGGNRLTKWFLFFFFFVINHGTVGCALIQSLVIYFGSFSQARIPPRVSFIFHVWIGFSLSHPKLVTEGNELCFSFFLLPLTPAPHPFFLVSPAMIDRLTTGGYLKWSFVVSWLPFSLLSCVRIVMMTRLSWFVWFPVPILSFRAHSNWTDEQYARNPTRSSDRFAFFTW